MDGQLPKNEFGNIEIFDGKIPKGCCHLEEEGVWRACRSLAVDYRHAVIGFDRRKGRTVPLKHGIVILQQNRSKIMNKYKKMLKEIKEKEKERKLKELKNYWKILLKTMLFKCYMNREHSIDIEYK